MPVDPADRSSRPPSVSPAVVAAGQQVAGPAQAGSAPGRVPAGALPTGALEVTGPAQGMGGEPLAGRSLRLPRMSRWPHWLWLGLLGLLCVAELATHVGDHSGFVVSSRPQYSPYGALTDVPAEGYVSWIGTTPVLHDAESVLTVTAFFLGQRGPAATGFLDRRAAYAYLASLAVPWAGAYGGFLVVNALLWWAAAAAAYWFANARWGDRRLALASSLLVATGNGFIFVAGQPMSYVATYAAVMLLLALGERLRAFSRTATLRTWLLLGWGAGVASLLYFAHIPLLIFWWLHGLRRVPWRWLLAATAVTFAIALSWERFGQAVVGLDFATDNSGLVAGAARTWLARLQASPIQVLTYLRSSPVRGTLIGAFPYPWWVLAGIGYLRSSREDREWAGALFMSGLLPTIAMLTFFSLPRVTYHIYPLFAVLAARGALATGQALSRAVALGRPAARTQQWAGGAVALALLGSLVLLSNLDLLGFQRLNAWFHFSAGFAW